MSYIKQEWHNGRTGGTPTSASRFQHMEDGIQEQSDRVDALQVDPRLSDARAPKPHNHPQTDVTGLATALANKVDASDARLSDARTPKPHAATHATDATDPLTPADIGADSLVGSYRHSARALRDKLATNQRCVWAHLGDSTANGIDEWLQLALYKFCGDYPNQRFEHRLWSDGNQNFDAASMVQSGISSGVEPSPIVRDTFTRTAAALSGTAADTGQVWGGGNGTLDGAVYTIGNVAASIVHGIDPNGPDGVIVRGRFTIPSGTTSGNARLFALGYNGTDELFAEIGPSATGLGLNLYQRVGGIATNIGSGVSVTLANTADRIADLSLSLKAGQATATLTANGTTVIRSAALSVPGGWVGYAASARNLVITAPAGFKLDDVSAGLNAPDPASLVVYNGSMPGASLAYHQARVAAMLPEAPDLVTIASSHNHGTQSTAAFLAQIDALVSAVLALYPNAGIALVSQNPQFPPANNAAVRAAHNTRIVAVGPYARARGFGYIAAAEPFLGRNDRGQGVVVTDGIHPSATGSVLWRDAGLSYLRGQAAHAESHRAGGNDPLTPADIGALDQAAGDARYPLKGDLAVNVRDYGAKGDGATDDIAAFQAAQAAVVAAKGGTIFVPPGQYMLSNSILLNSGVTLRGVGTGYNLSTMRTKLQLMSSAPDVPVITNADHINGNTRITIEDVVVQAKAGNTQGCIWFQGGSNESTACKVLRIARCLMFGTGQYSIKLGVVQESEILHNYAVGSAGPALLLDGSFDNHITGNQLTVGPPAVTGGHGIYLTSSSDHNIITENFCFLCDTGITVDNGNRNVISSNRCNTNLREGIALRPNGAGVFAYGNVVNGNVCYDNGTSLAGTRAGIAVDNGTASCTIIGNTSTETRVGAARTQDRGIRIAATAADNVILGNAALNNISGPFLDTSSGDNFVFGNAWPFQGGSWLMGNMTSAGGGKRVIGIPDGVPPTANPVSGGFLYAEAGSLKWRGSNGIVGISELDLAKADARYVLGTVARDAVTTSTAGAGIVVKGSAVRLPLVTPDGNTGAVTHPSVYFNPRGWNGKRYWMAATPYYNATVAFENPCIWQSDDGDNWTVPAGLTNPIEAFPGGTGYNSDPHLIEGPDGRLYCFWRQYRPDLSGQQERIYYRASSNGVDWSDKQTVLLNDSTVRRLVAPAITYDNGVWTMWTVDIVPSPNTVVRLTASSPTGPWSAPQTCTGLSAPNGRDVWHVDVHRIGSEYVMLFSDSALDSSTGGVLFRAVSRNGLTWTQDAGPFLMPVGNRWDSSLYRSCLLPARVNGADGYEVWYSSAQGPNWGVGHTVAQIVPTRPRQDDPINLASASGLYPGWYLGDLVGRADSTTSPGVATSGQTWAVDTGTLGIQGRRIYAPAATNSRATINLGSGIVDCEVGATAAVLPSPTGQTWIIARYVDGNNYVRAGLNAGTWMIQDVTAGTATTICSLGAPLYAPANGDRFALRCKGTAAELYVNEQLIAVGTTTQLTGTSVGVQTQNVDSRFATIYAKAA